MNLNMTKSCGSFVAQCPRYRPRGDEGAEVDGVPLGLAGLACLVCPRMLGHCVTVLIKLDPLGSEQLGTVSTVLMVVLARTDVWCVAPGLS